MDTSKTVKLNQKNPPAILEGRDNAWLVEGRDRPSYWVTRNRDRFWCSCEAGRRGLLCRHVQAVISSLVRGKFRVVQFWTTQDDAARQHRRTVTFYAKGKIPFWVTFAGRIDPVESLDAEIRDLGERYAEARRVWFRTGDGQRKANARVEMEQLRVELMDRQVTRERAVAERKIA